MTYTHLTTNELVIIEAYYQEGEKVSTISQSLARSRQTIYHVINFLKAGNSAYDYYRQYKINKKRCGQGKRKSNGKKETRGKQAFRRDIRERSHVYPDFNTEFGHLGGDTIVGKHHKSAVITLVERQSKAIITLQTDGQKPVLSNPLLITGCHNFQSFSSNR